MNLLIALVVLILVGLCLIAGLFMIRARRRKQRQQAADMPFQASPRPTSRFSTHTLLRVTTGQFGRHSKAATANEKEILIDEQELGSTTNSVPEIRITFPEEEEVDGKRRSGRVVVVNISETGGVGLEPYNDEHLPAYQKSDSERFQDLDLERIGGLKELKESKM